MSCEYVRNYYGVPAETGRLVCHAGRPGIIAEDRGNYIGVNFDDEKPGQVHNVHPTDENLEYLGMGKVRKMTRSQRHQNHQRSYRDKSPLFSYIYSSFENN